MVYVPPTPQQSEQCNCVPVCQLISCILSLHSIQNTGFQETDVEAKGVRGCICTSVRDAASCHCCHNVNCWCKCCCQHQMQMFQSRNAVCPTMSSSQTSWLITGSPPEPHDIIPGSESQLRFSNSPDNFMGRKWLNQLSSDPLITNTCNQTTQILTKCESVKNHLLKNMEEKGSTYLWSMGSGAGLSLSDTGGDIQIFMSDVGVCHGCGHPGFIPLDGASDSSSTDHM